MALGPVVASAALTEYKIIGPENLTEWPGTDRVHRAWLQVDQNRAGHVFTTRCLIVVDVDAFQLQIRVSVVRSGRVNAMLIGNNFPELKETITISNQSTDLDFFKTILAVIYK